MSFYRSDDVIAAAGAFSSWEDSLWFLLAGASNKK
jgi:hypothetical protein